MGFGIQNIDIWRWIQRQFIFSSQIWNSIFQILGFDSLEFIPLLAIIILSFRKESLMQVNTFENTETILSDLSSIKILPLIQLTLSSRD